MQIIDYSGPYEVFGTEGFEVYTVAEQKQPITTNMGDNGKIITTAGLSSGIDGALHVVAVLHGLGRAQQTALNLEYNWQPELNFARAAKS